MNDERFTPAELKELVASGDLQMSDLKLLHPEDAKVAFQIIASQKVDDIPNAKLNAMPGPPFGKVPGTVTRANPSNVEKLSKEAFDDVGKVQRTGATKAISEGDRFTQILFGGLNAVGKKYPPVKKPPVGPQDLLQMIQNVKEVSKAGFKGVTRRSPK